jgi:hypothetical protein
MKRGDVVLEEMRTRRGEKGGQMRRRREDGGNPREYESPSVLVGVC